MKTVITVLALSGASLHVHAGTPAQILADYVGAAQAGAPGFVASPGRGEQFFQRRFDPSSRLAACTTCHTDDPRRAGRHAVTDKAIEPLAPVANADRLRDPARVEKWLRRNCRDVVGRDCSAAEKADVVAYLQGVR